MEYVTLELAIPHVPETLRAKSRDVLETGLTLAVFDGTVTLRALEVTKDTATQAAKRISALPDAERETVILGLIGSVRQLLLEQQAFATQILSTAEQLDALQAQCDQSPLFVGKRPYPPTGERPQDGRFSG